LATPIDFEKLLLDSIDEALQSMGETAKKAIYFHFEKEFNLNKDQIPQHLDQFQLALEKIFGIGSSYIEILIMKNLHRKTNRTVQAAQNANLEFVRYVDSVRCSYEPEFCEK
jgi:hypothetical protein